MFTYLFLFHIYFIVLNACGKTDVYYIFVNDYLLMCEKPILDGKKLQNHLKGTGSLCNDQAGNCYRNQ